MARIVPALALFALFAVTARADYDAGIMAFNRGDFATAVSELQPLADQGHARAQFQVGVMHANGNGVPQSLREALRYYRLAAEQGLPEAQQAMGFTYRVGNGVRPDDSEASKWYRLAAEAGIAEAQYHLATYYGRGIGVPQDYVQAFKWFSLAAAGGVAQARSSLFFCMDYLNEDQIAEAEMLATQWRPRE